MANTPITSSKQALSEALKLKSIWSKESFLSLRTLIYCASLLEQIAKKRNRPNRKKSAWNKFLGQKLKEGKSMSEAAKLYKDVPN